MLIHLAGYLNGGCLRTHWSSRQQRNQSQSSP